MPVYRLHFIIFLLFLIPAFAQSPELKPYQIVDMMIERTKRISSMSFTMKKKERIKGSFPTQESDVKLHIKPFRFYMKQKRPKKGLEVLYIEKENNNKAIVNTNGFPWVNVYLDPMGSTMRNDQHHTIFESGYGHLMSILDHLTDKYRSDLETMIKITGETEWENKQCWIIVLDNPHFKYSEYKIQPGESVLTIAGKMKLSEHMIQEINHLSSFDVAPGRVLKIPNDYSPKLEIYIEKQTYLPFVMKVYDDKGLYEHYEYSNVKINPSFNEKDFDKNNSDYGF